METSKSIVNRTITNASRAHMQGISANIDTRLRDPSVVLTLATHAVFLLLLILMPFSLPYPSSTCLPRLLRACPLASDPDMSILSGLTVFCIAHAYIP